jgi:hypothetical protein
MADVGPQSRRDGCEPPAVSGARVKRLQSCAANFVANVVCQDQQFGNLGDDLWLVKVEVRLCGILRGEADCRSARIIICITYHSFP